MSPRKFIPAFYLDELLASCPFLIAATEWLERAHHQFNPRTAVPLGQRRDEPIHGSDALRVGGSRLFKVHHSLPAINGGSLAASAACVAHRQSTDQDG